MWKLRFRKVTFTYLNLHTWKPTSREVKSTMAVPTLLPGSLLSAHPMPWEPVGSLPWVWSSVQSQKTKAQVPVRYSQGCGGLTREVFSERCSCGLAMGSWTCSHQPRPCAVLPLNHPLPPWATGLGSAPTPTPRSPWESSRPACSCTVPFLSSGLQACPMPGAAWVLGVWSGSRGTDPHPQRLWSWGESFQVAREKAVSACCLLRALAGDQVRLLAMCPSVGPRADEHSTCVWGCGCRCMEAWSSCNHQSLPQEKGRKLGNSKYRILNSVWKESTANNTFHKHDKIQINKITLLLVNCLIYPSCIWA